MAHCDSACVVEGLEFVFVRPVGIEAADQTAFTARQILVANLMYVMKSQIVHTTFDNFHSITT